MAMANMSKAETTAIVTEAVKLVAQAQVEQKKEKHGPTAPDLPPFVGLEKGADLVDVSVPTLRRWLTQKRLRRFKVGGHTVLKTTELLGLVKEAK
jgi:hypothetical protein